MTKVLSSAQLETPIGRMLAIGDDQFLYFLEFDDCPVFQKGLNKLLKKTSATISPGRSKAIDSIEMELKLYFQAKLKSFNTPLLPIGTPFQRQVWGQLQKIPYGETCSYSDLANAVKKPSACRAVANANGSNLLTIVIPCHRVIGADGGIGGYGGGIKRKQELLHLENPKGKRLLRNE